MSDKQDALIEVVDLITRHGLTIDDVSAALKGEPAFKAAKSGGILSRLFTYIGGTFVIVGLSIYVGLRWDDLDALGRVMVTLGPGFCIFVLALVCTTDPRTERVATPLFVLAALVQPTGILVMLQEYSSGGEPAHGVLFMNGVMAIQQGCTFIARRRTVLALTTIFFTLGFFTIAFDLLGVHHNLIGLVMGASLICIAWSLDRSRHRSIAGLAYFFGSGIFLAAAWDWLHNTVADPLFLALACGGIFLSTVARSRSLLLVATIALVGYLGDFINDRFGDDLSGPLMLIVIGFVLIGFGVLAVAINNRFIVGRSGRTGLTVGRASRWTRPTLSISLQSAPRSIPSRPESSAAPRPARTRGLVARRARRGADSRAGECR